MVLGLGTRSDPLLFLPAAVQGRAYVRVDYLHLVLVAGTMSVVTHVLATLRTWAGR